MARLGPSGILIATAAWAGLDAPVPWRSIIVPVVPFERPTIIDEQVESRYIDVRNTAVRRLRQVIGRLQTAEVDNVTRLGGDSFAAKCLKFFE